MSRDSESEHDPGGFEAGAEVGEEYRHMSEDAYGEGPVGPIILDEAVTVDVADVMPELADPEVVAEIVAPTRDIDTEVGEPLVELDDVTVKFGGLTALDSVTFNINRGEILGLIGPNGAGKTTCFNAMTGVYRPTSGTVTFDHQVMAKLEAQPDHPARHRPHLPERPAVRRDDRAGERGRRHRRPAQDLGARRDLPHPAAPA